MASWIGTGKIFKVEAAKEWESWTPYHDSGQCLTAEGLWDPYPCLGEKANKSRIVRSEESRGWAFLHILLSSLFGSSSEAYIWDQCSSGAQHKILLWHLSLVVAYSIILSLARQLGGTYVPYTEQLFHEYLLALYIRMKSKGTSRKWYPLEVMRNLSLRKLRLSKGKIKEGSNVNQRVIWVLEANKCINENFKGCK